MERTEQLSIAEALILASPEPIPLPRLASLIPSCKPAAARALVDELNAEYAKRGRAFEISEVGGRLPDPHPAGLCQLRAGEPARAPAAALPGLARDALGDRLPAAGDARRGRVRARRGRGRRAAQPARAASGAHRGSPRGAGPPVALRHHAALPRGLRAGADRGSSDAARAGRARARGAGGIDTDQRRIRGGSRGVLRRVWGGRRRAAGGTRTRTKTSTADGDSEADSE